MKDFDVDRGTIVVRSGKGNKDRVTLLPKFCREALQGHLLRVSELHTRDRLAGAGYAPMPDTLYRKYPAAARSLGWQYAFPSAALRHWPALQVTVRWHASPSTVQKAFKKALASSGIRRRQASTRCAIPSSHLLANGTDIRRIQSLLGQAHGHLAIGPAPHLTGCGSSASRTTPARKVLSPSVRSRGVSRYAPLTASWPQPVIRSWSRCFLVKSSSRFKMVVGLVGSC